MPGKKTTRQKVLDAWKNLPSTIKQRSNEKKEIERITKERTDAMYSPGKVAKQDMYNTNRKKVKKERKAWVKNPLNNKNPLNDKNIYK